MTEFLHQKFFVLLLLALSVFLCGNVSTTTEKECTEKKDCKSYFECPENEECLYRICTAISSGIKCKPGSVIDIKDFMFGSVDVKVCAKRNSVSVVADCKPNATLEAKQMENIKRLCQNETECQLKAAFDARDECMIKPENLWGDPCNAKPKYITVNFTCVAGNGWNYWSKWGAWDHCSTTCGNGTQKRNRTCIDSPQKNCTTSTCAKKKFPANQYESYTCNQRSCPAESSSLQITKLISPSTVSISGEETSYTSPPLESRSSIQSHTSESVALKDSIALTTAAQYITSTYGFEKDSDFGSSTSFILPTSSSMFIFKSPSSSVSLQTTTTSQLLLKSSSMLFVSSSIPLLKTASIQTLPLKSTTDVRLTPSFKHSNVPTTFDSQFVSSLSLFLSEKASPSIAVTQTQMPISSHATSRLEKSPAPKSSMKMRTPLQKTTNILKPSYSKSPKATSSLTERTSTAIIERPISTKIVLPSMSKIFPTSSALQSSSAIIIIIPPTTKPEQPEIYVTTKFKLTWEEFYKLQTEFREGIAKVLSEKVEEKVDADQIVLINIDEWETNPQGEAVVKFYVKNKDKDTANEEFTKLAGQIMLDLLSEGNTTQIGKQFGNGVISQVVVVEPSRKDDDDDGLAVWLIVLIVIAAIIFMLWFCCCLWMFCVKKRRKREFFSDKYSLSPLPLENLPIAAVNDNTSISSADEPAELTTFSTSIVVNDYPDDNDKEIMGVANPNYENEVDLSLPQEKSTFPVVNVTLLPPSPSASIKKEESSEEDDADGRKDVDSIYEPMYPAVTSNYDDKPPESPASNIPDGDLSDSDSDSESDENDGDDDNDSIGPPKPPRSPGVTRVFIGGKLVQEIPIDQVGREPISVKLSTL